MPTLGFRLALASAAAAAAVAGAPCVAQRPETGYERLVRELRDYPAPEPWRMAEALGRVGDLATARDVLKRATEEAENPDGAFNHPGTLIRIAEVQSQLGDRDGALKMLLRARKAALGWKQREASLCTYLAEVGEAQLRLKDKAAADESFKDALRCVAEFEPDPLSMAIQNVLRVRAEAGDWDGVVDTAASLPDAAHKVDALWLIVNDGAKIPKGALERLLRMLDSIGAVPPDVQDGADRRKGALDGLRVETLVGLALKQGDDRVAARKLLDRARKVADGARGEKEGNSHLLWKVALGLAMTDAVDEGFALVDTDKAEPAATKSSLLRMAADAFEERGDHAAALKGWRASLPGMEAGNQKAFLLMEIADAHVRAGDKGLALKALQEAREALKAVKVSDRFPAELRKADPARAARMDATEREMATSSVATAFARAGDFRTAFRIAESIEDRQLRVGALAGIAGAQASSGDVKAALETARSIKPLAPEEKHITHISDESSAFLGVISAQAGSGDLDGAFATLDQFVKDENLRFVALLVMAGAYGERNKPAKAAPRPPVPVNAASP